MTDSFATGKAPTGSFEVFRGWANRKINSAIVRPTLSYEGGAAPVHEITDRGELVIEVGAIKKNVLLTEEYLDALMPQLLKG